MSHEVGIWIDHKKAVIVSVTAGHATVRTVESDVGRHPHYSGSQERGGEKKYEERHGLHLDQYYDRVISQLGEPDALVLLGPGEAKLQLKDRLGRSRVMSESVGAVERTDKLTDRQIVAKVKEYYGIARRGDPRLRRHAPRPAFTHHQRSGPGKETPHDVLPARSD